MKIAYLVNQYPGISHTFVRREIQALERRGGEVVRFAVRASKQPVIAPEDHAEAGRTRYIISAGIARLASAIGGSLAAAPGQSAASFVEALKMGWRSEAGLARHAAYWAEAMALAGWLRAEKLTHVHAHFGTNSAAVAMLAAKISGGGFSMTVHGPEEFDKPELIALAEKIRASVFTVAVSSYGASQLRRLVAPEFWPRIKIVRCGLESAFSAGAAPGAMAPHFVSVGRLSEQKGQLTLIEAAARLKETGANFKVTLVGDGAMRGVLEDAAKHLGVRDRIVFAGWKTPADVRAEIESARVFVLPSYAEGLPVSIMEALALGRPVISTYVAGIPELVAPGENGWLVPAGDDAALGHAMSEALAASDEKISAMGRAGMARIAADHDIDKIAAQLKSLFEDALAARSP